MKFALGVLHWSPDTFWNATFYEVSCAYTGHCEVNRVEGFGRSLTEEEAAELQEVVEDLRERFPDGKMSKAEKRAARAN